MDKLEGARAAFLKGTANAEQLHLLEQERAGEEIGRRNEENKRRTKEEGWLGGVKKLFRGSGARGADAQERTLVERAEELKNSERAFVEREAEGRRFMQGGREVELRPAAVENSAVAGVGLDERGRPVPLGKMEAVPVGTSTKKSDSPIIAEVQARRGGQLDALAENITSSAQSTGSTWWGSIFGGSKS